MKRKRKDAFQGYVMTYIPATININQQIDIRAYSITNITQLTMDVAYKQQMKKQLAHSHVEISKDVQLLIMRINFSITQWSSSTQIPQENHFKNFYLDISKSTTRASN